jgi:hypothetical protein
MIIEEGSLLEILALTKSSYYSSMPAKIIEEGRQEAMVVASFWKSNNDVIPIPIVREYRDEK